MINNHGQVSRVIARLTEGLYICIKREMRKFYGKHWVVAATQYVEEDRITEQSVDKILQVDASAQVKLMRCK